MAQTDPGPRGGAAGAGAVIPGLTIKEAKFFDSGLDAFTEVASVTGSVPGTEGGLGPRFNLDSCVGCHKHPAIGGSSPAGNPQVNPALSSAAQVNYVTNTVPILSLSGPIREVRFSTDGGVHDLFVITGRPDSPAGCNIAQPDFVTAAGPSFPGVLRFRIPTPTFGLGLIEAIEDATILANLGPKPYGIVGRVNRNGNDGTVTRFGWKAQNKSLAIFSGEAYNVEMGVTNALFPDERGEGGLPDPVACRQLLAAPQDTVHYDLTQPQAVPDDANNFANFMRFLAAPTPVPSYTGVTSSSINSGRNLFSSIGCATCHTPSMQTGNHTTAALRNKTANLYSDLLIHHMGLLGDGISQGDAGGDEFRTAPLWGLGQRLFFLHDGRTNNLLAAIQAHANGGSDSLSEANEVIQNFNALSNAAKQDILNFLRSL